MLLNLHIKNYALISDLHLEFPEGLNIFTGETGAGKSIIIESLGLILGDRASLQMIKKGASSCMITAEFDIAEMKGLKNYLEEIGMDSQENESLILRREMDVSGKSRAFANDLPISLAALNNIGKFLVDIHGQHEHQTLIQSVYQQNILDTFGGLEETACILSKKYESYKEILLQSQSQTMSEQEKQRLIDLYSFQVKEIEDANLHPGEEEEIEQTLPKLKNVDKLQNLSQEAKDILYYSEGSCMQRILKLQKIMENINNTCQSLSQTAENVKSAYYLLEECEKEIEDFSKSLESDPKKLNDTLERQYLIDKLKKKYGQNISEIIGYKNKVSQELSSILQSGQNKLELEKKLEKELKGLIKLCEDLTGKRKITAKKLSAQVEKEIQDLGMKKARFDISISREPEPSSNGWDRIEFMFCANPGEDLKPLKSIASGGETSRVMLALKTVLAKADRVPVLVFDEIDAGIGGPMGQTIGKKLKDLSKHHQILCITHLPQIASFAGKHFSVEKIEQNKQTMVTVKPLQEKERLEEISRMVSGEEITQTTRKHAAELIKQSKPG
ncbi:MAG: DNA repair protein RecN [Elusimicrobia bacterium]|nr:DNA repair protein RecN [Candidatus Liberimonas magnetica]